MMFTTYHAPKLAEYIKVTLTRNSEYTKMLVRTNLIKAVKENEKKKETVLELTSGEEYTINETIKEITKLLTHGLTQEELNELINN